MDEFVDEIDDNVIIDNVIIDSVGVRRLKLHSIGADIVTLPQEEQDVLSRCLGEMGLKIAIIDQSDFGNCFYNSVIYGINRLAAPFNIQYNVTVLRRKTAEYIMGHPERFLDVMSTSRERTTYCNLVRETRKYADHHIEVKALAHALQLQIIVMYVSCGNVYSKCIGGPYSDGIRIGFNHRASQFNPIVSILECDRQDRAASPSDFYFPPSTVDKRKRSKNGDIENN